MGIVGLLSFAAACSPGQADVSYSPSLTAVRIGEAEVEEEVVIPEDFYIPGIVLNSEDYGTDSSDALGKTDLSGMEDLKDPAALTEHVSYKYAVADFSAAGW